MNFLESKLRVYLEKDTIRPDYLIKDVTDEQEDPREDLVWLFNRVREMDPVDHRGLKEALELELTKKHFLMIPHNGPAKLLDRSYVDMLPRDVWQCISPWLNDDDLLALSSTDKKMREIAFFGIYLKKHPKCKELNVKRNDPQELLVAICKSRIRFEQLNLPKKLDIPFVSLTFPATLTSCRLFSPSDKLVRRVASCCPNLKTVILEKGPVSFRAFSPKHPLKKLTRLELKSSVIKDAGLLYVLRACPKLEELSVNGSEGITGSTLVKYRRLAFLKELDLQSTALEGMNFIKILAKATALRVLDVSFCDGISKKDFTESAKRLSALERFTAHYTSFSASNGAL